MSYAIETYNLTKKFAVIKKYREIILNPFKRSEILVLSDVNLRVKTGQLFGLLGPNGAGKTTLIKILCTLVLPTSGDAFVNGMDVTKNGKSIRKAIGYVISDERSFYWRLTGRQNLKFFAKLNNITNGEAEIKINKLLDFLGLQNDANKMFKDYSTGMRQKLAIARGLLTDPEIIFMDEPTRSLDAISVQSLRKLVREKLVREEGKTVVFATHNLQEAEDICDGIGIIHRGELIMAGSVDEIRSALDCRKRYLITLKKPENGLLAKISRLSIINRVTHLGNSPLNDYIQLEIQTVETEGSGPFLIEKIIEMGGKVYSFQQIQTPLESLFARLVDRDESPTGALVP